MLTAALVTDLLRCAVDAPLEVAGTPAVLLPPDRDRRAAIGFLARELAAKLRTDPISYGANHRAFELGRGEMPSARVGDAVALSRAWGGYHQSSYFGVQTGAEPEGPQYSSDVPSDATALVAEIRGKLGTATFEAHRSIAPLGAFAEPGGIFVLEGLLSTQLPIATSSGTHRVQTDVAILMPHDNQPGRTVTIELRAGGGVVATHSLPRPAPTGDDEPREMMVHFSTSADVALDEDETVELHAAASNAAGLQSYGGVVRWWRL